MDPSTNILPPQAERYLRPHTKLSVQPYEAGKICVGVVPAIASVALGVSLEVPYQNALLFAGEMHRRRLPDARKSNAFGEVFL